MVNGPANNPSPDRVGQHWTQLASQRLLATLPKHLTVTEKRGDTAPGATRRRQWQQKPLENVKGLTSDPNVRFIPAAVGATLHFPGEHRRPVASKPSCKHKPERPADTRSAHAPVSVACSEEGRGRRARWRVSCSSELNIGIDIDEKAWDVHVECVWVCQAHLLLVVVV